MSGKRPGDVEGLVFDIDTFAVHDGPGIRMAVYLKGCPLSCRWCHSPESKATTPELIFLRERCHLCGACVAVCPAGVHEISPTGHKVERDRCRLCGACVANCPAEALVIKGRRVRAREIVDRAERMKPFFEHTGGGLTLTGGEAVMQPEFAAAVLEGCRRITVHTALETSGACDGATLSALADLSDLILYDLKLIDDAEHRRWTGVGNRRILENAARIAGPKAEIRVPLIPGITDTDENLEGIFRFCVEHGLRRVALLPSNPSAGAKYEWLGLDYDLSSEPQTAEHLAEIIETAEGLGLNASVA